jgi:ElaB/YqjD/DUF883 family membrane-anchored ribosome-binding protein
MEQHNRGSQSGTATEPLRKNQPQSVGEQATEVARDLQHKAEEAVDMAKEKATQVSTQASEKIDSAMTSVGEQMQNAAKTVRENAPEGKIGDVAQSAASALERSGRYLREADTEAVRNDLEDLIRRYPIESLMVGLGIGFLLARSFRR